MRFVLRRLGFFLLTLWAALTLNFFIPRFMPGSPLDALRDRTHNKLSPDALQQMLTSFGFKPHQNVVRAIPRLPENMVTGHWGSRSGNARRAGEHAGEARRCRGRSAWSASPPCWPSRSAR